MTVTPSTGWAQPRSSGESMTKVKQRWMRRPVSAPLSTPAESGLMTSLSKSVRPRLAMAACQSAFSLMTSTTWNSSITTGTCPSTTWSSLWVLTTRSSASETTTSHESFVDMSTSMLRTRRSASPAVSSRRLSGSTRPT